MMITAPLVALSVAPPLMLTGVTSMLNRSPHDHTELIRKLHSVVLMHTLLNLQMACYLDAKHLLSKISHATKKSRISSKRAPMQ
jgi:hypothetical protein